jgi:hypothetical protein
MAFDPTGEEIEVPVAELAKLHLPDPNAANPIGVELMKLVGIGLFFTVLIVAIVYFVVKK